APPTVRLRPDDRGSGRRPDRDRPGPLAAEAALIGVERAGAALSEEYQLVPEQATEAIVIPAPTSEPANIPTGPQPRCDTRGDGGVPKHHKNHERTDHCVLRTHRGTGGEPPTSGVPRHGR